MTCPFCGIPDERIGDRHYERHQIEYLQRIAKALEELVILFLTSHKALEQLAELVGRKVEGP